MIKGYLDNASSTETKFFAKDFYIPGNPNSPTAIGRKAREALEQAKQRVKDCLGAKGGEVVFCRCATEAVEKLADLFNGIVDCSPYEHDSVFHACLGSEVESKSYGEFVDSMRGHYYENNFLYLHQHVNQITGTVFDIKSIGEMCREHEAFFGCDLTASIGHTSLPDGLESFCDAVWFSGHKLHAEQGIGVLWIGDALKAYIKESWINRKFEGTPNVSGAVAMSYAMDHAIDSFSENYSHYLDLYYTLIEKLHSYDIVFTDVGDLDRKSLLTVAIFALTLPGFNADALVTYLSSRGVYISAGHSACAEHDDFRVLEAFGLTKEEASQTIRVSFCEDTTLEDIDMLVDGIVEFKEEFM